MGKGKKKDKPPYDIKDADHCYIAIENPWGLGMAPRECVREQRRMDIAASRIAAWVRTALGNPNLSIEEVYFKGGNFNHVIVPLPKSTNILPILGWHQWIKFAKRARCDPSSASSVFEHDFVKQGKPEAHGWSAGIAEDSYVIDIESPYPRPTTFAVVPSSLRGHVLPFPDIKEPDIKPFIQNSASPPPVSAPKPAPLPTLPPPVGPFGQAFRAAHTADLRRARPTSSMPPDPALEVRTSSPDRSVNTSSTSIVPPTPLQSVESSTGIRPLSDHPNANSHAFEPYRPPAHLPGRSLLTTARDDPMRPPALPIVPTTKMKNDPEDEAEVDRQLRQSLRDASATPAPALLYSSTTPDDVIGHQSLRPTPHAPSPTPLLRTPSVPIKVEDPPIKLEVPPPLPMHSPQLQSSSAVLQSEQSTTNVIDVQLNKEQDVDVDEDEDPEQLAMLALLMGQACAREPAEATTVINSSIARSSGVPDTNIATQAIAKDEEEEEDQAQLDLLELLMAGAGQGSMNKVEPTERADGRALKTEIGRTLHTDVAVPPAGPERTAVPFRIKPEPVDVQLPAETGDTLPSTSDAKQDAPTHDAPPLVTDGKQKAPIKTEASTPSILPVPSSAAKDVKPLAQLSFPLGAKYNGHVIYTPNATYIPAPSQPTELAIQNDFWLGAEDPVLWPQEFHHHPDLSYLCALPARPPRHSSTARDSIIWGALERLHTEPRSVAGQALCVLSPSRRREAEAFMDDFEHNFLGSGHRSPTLLRLLATQRAGIQALQRPSAPSDLRLAWRHLQRTWLQVIAYIDFHSGTRLEDRVGAFVRDEVTAAHLAERGIPVWVHRPIAEGCALGVRIERLESVRHSRDMKVDTVVARNAPSMDIQPPYDTASIIKAIDTCTARLFGMPPTSQIMSESPVRMKRERAEEEQEDVKRVKIEPLD